MALETFIHNVEQDVSTQNPQTKANHNLGKHERKALRSLQTAVVVIDKEHYISEANPQLYDTTYYKGLDQTQPLTTRYL